MLVNFNATLEKQAHTDFLTIQVIGWLEPRPNDVEDSEVDMIF